MANVQKIVRTNAVLTYLASRGSATLREIAEHFGTPWQSALGLLWDASLVDVAGMPIPFDLQLPMRAEASPDSIVRLEDTGAGEVPPLPLGLDEAMVLVALIDQVLEVSAPGDSREALRDVRSKLSEAATNAGFGSAIWPEPEPPISSDTLGTVTRAVAERRMLTIGYHRAGPDLHEQVETVDLIPFGISTGTAPVLHAARELAGELTRRTYRLDRIGSAALGEQIPERTWNRARRVPLAEWTPTGQTVTLFVTRQGKWAAETLPGVTYTESDEMLVLSLPVASEEWLFSLLVQLGDTVVAVDPPEIADHMAKRATQLLKETS